MGKSKSDKNTYVPTHILSFKSSDLKPKNNDKMSEISPIIVSEIKTLRDFNRYYRGSIDSSLDFMHLQTVTKDACNIIKLNNRTNKEKLKKYCNLIIDFKFDNPIWSIKENEKSYSIKSKKHEVVLVERPYKWDKVGINLKKLHTLIYLQGFDVIFQKADGKQEKYHYIHYKRSSSKVKNGSCLFIREDLYSQMISWSHLDLPKPQGEIDLASLNAYESLPLSGLEQHGEQTIKINAKNILLVNDLLGDKFNAYQSVVTRNNNEIVCENQWRNVQNACSDGECLLDESLFPVFEVNRDKKQHGFMLLRQRFFKSAALNTKIIDFYKNHFGDQYETAYVKDKFGRDIKVSDIRMIVCPSSLKLLKLSGIWFKNENDCYEHWLKKLDQADGVFGIVKHEKPSPFRFNYNQLSYQMINSLPLDENGVKQLLGQEFKYISALKNDIQTFIQHIHGDSKESDESEDVEIKSSREFIKAMLKICPDFYKTQLFKDFRHDTIENYRKVLRKGKIKTQCDYSVQFGNPWELLLSTVKSVSSNDVVAKGRECYCPRFQKPNRGLSVFRSPHICIGNILYAQNVWHEEYQWFNLTNNIVLVNAWDNDWFDRTQGSDCDSDALLLVSNEQLVSIAKACDIIPQEGKEFDCLYPTPVNDIVGDKTLRKYTLENMAEIDHIISENNIGKVVNMSQLLNSYYWHIKTDRPDSPEKEKLLGDIYKQISICSALSQVEIDKAKKMYKNLAVKRILKKMTALKDSNGERLMQLSERKIEKSFFDEAEGKQIIEEQTKLGSLKEYTNSKGVRSINLNKSVIKELSDDIKYQKYKSSDDEELDYILKLDKPLFFQYCSTDKNVIFKSFHTPMDYLEQILSDDFPRVEKGKTIKTMDIMELIEGKGKVNYEQLENICNIVSNAKSKIKANYASDEEQNIKDNEVFSIREEAITELKNLKISPAIVYYIFNKIYGGGPECKESEKEWKEKLKKIALTLIGMLYEAQPELMQNVFKSNKKAEPIEEQIAG